MPRMPPSTSSSTRSKKVTAQHYELDLESWKSTVAKRMAFLDRQGITPVTATA